MKLFRKKEHNDFYNEQPKYEPKQYDQTTRVKESLLTGAILFLFCLVGYGVYKLVIWIL